MILVNLHVYVVCVWWGGAYLSVGGDLHSVVITYVVLGRSRPPPMYDYVFPGLWLVWMY